MLCDCLCSDLTLVGPSLVKVESDNCLWKEVVEDRHDDAEELNITA
jgi:hypothetical protein